MSGFDLLLCPVVVAVQEAEVLDSLNLLISFGFILIILSRVIFPSQEKKKSFSKSFPYLTE